MYFTPYKSPKPNTSRYQTTRIRYKNTLFLFKKNLISNVEYEDAIYLIHNEELDLIVWGESRKEVEDAFSSNFYSMYINFYLVEDDKLTDKAILLKNKMKKLLKVVIEEDPFVKVKA